MIPSVIQEQECHPFKFWFNGEVQDGMVYRNELFYRLQTVAESHRAKLYQRACQLAQQEPGRKNTIIVTTSGQVCSIWLSLRSTNLRGTKLPQYTKYENNLEV